MRLLISVVIAMSAAVATADTITTTSGREIECIVLQEGAQSVTYRIGYGTMTLPRQVVASVKRAPILTDAPTPTKPPSAGARIPPWSS